ncbi:MAG: T9SS type A sorting domain-containing protein [Saprospiraceae bacterium]|nr:T9SS type A sorting domain-containing protein [Saprospiraceae bacterium]
MKQIIQFLFNLSLPFFTITSLNAQTTVVDVVVNSPDHTILEEAVIAADLAGTLSGDGPFTLFAPTDDAFNALPDGTVDALLADPSGTLTDILLYHALAADVRSTDLVDGTTATTINGKDVNVTINSNGVFINDAQVTVADIVTDNGVVHVIDAVLLPPTVTVVDVVVNSPDHTILEAAVIAADLAGTLSGDGPFTLFAPTDDAFSALPDGTIDALLADPAGTLTDILLYHAIAGDIRSTDLVDGTSAATINGKDVNITIDSNGVFINDAQVTVADIVTDNGVVHVIDAVLLPPTVTVVDVVVNSPDHTILEAAVIAADLAGTLSGDGPFTLFAPTDDAFSALPDGTIDALLADPSGALTDILLYHAIAGDIRSTDLVDGTTATTINGKDVNITINSNGVFINDAQVTVADIVTDNGVVHVIDAVLLPPTSSIESIDLAKFIVYPNPTSNYINIEMEDIDINNSKLNIITIQGRIIGRVQGNDLNSQIDVSSLNEGTYFLEFTNENNRYYKKLVISK